MATPNAFQTLEQATDFGTNWAGCTLVVLDGAVVLATHTVTSWTPSNSGNDGVATANMAAAGAANIDIGGTADGGELRSGNEVIVIPVGELNLTTTNYIQNETSTVNSMAVTFPSV